MAREFQIYKVGAKIMKTNDFYKTINGIESFFELNNSPAIYTILCRGIKFQMR